METPKKKAIKLKDKFFKLFSNDAYDWITNEEAIECAKIAVDEILEVTHSDKRGNSPFDTEYWQEVKQELEKLL